MSKYTVILSVHASISVDVEADSEEQAKELALKKADCPTLCHYCADKIEIGDVDEALDAEIKD